MHTCTFNFCQQGEQASHGPCSNHLQRASRSCSQRTKEPIITTLRVEIEQQLDAKERKSWSRRDSGSCSKSSTTSTHKARVGGTSRGASPLGAWGHHDHGNTREGTSTRGRISKAGFAKPHCRDQRVRSKSGECEQGGGGGGEEEEGKLHTALTKSFFCISVNFTPHHADRRIQKPQIIVCTQLRRQFSFMRPRSKTLCVPRNCLMSRWFQYLCGCQAGVI